MAEEASLTFPLVLLSLSFAFTVYLNRQAIIHTLQACGKYLYRCVHNSEKKTRHMTRKTARRIRQCIARHHQSGENVEYELLDMSGNTATVLDDGGLEYASESESCGDSTYSTDSTYTSSQSHIIASDSASKHSRNGEISDVTQYSPRSIRLASTRLSGTGLIDMSVHIMPMEWEVERARRLQQGGPSTWLHRVVDWTVERVQANFEAGNETSEFDHAPYTNVHNDNNVPAPAALTEGCAA